MKNANKTSQNITPPPHAKNVNNSNIFSHIKSYFKNLKQSNSTVEHGRSMVEMLGVLAVIGVLSIGGIAGYQLSMNKLRANELIHEVNMRRIALYQQFLKDPDNIDMELGSVTKHGYTITSETDPIEDDMFYINLEDIPQGICKQIINQNWTDPLDIYVNNRLTAENDASECGSSDTVSMSFKFDKSGMEGDESIGSNDDDNDNNPEQSDSDYENLPETTTTLWPETTTTLWPETTTTLWPETTTTIVGCPSNHFSLYDGTCYSCTTSSAILGAFGCESECPNRVLNADYCALKCTSGYFMGVDAKCYSCDTSSSIPVDMAQNIGQCGRCSNRTLNGNYCVLK